MLGSRYIETGQMIGAFSYILKCKVTAACTLVTTRIIRSQHDLWCPLLPPTFFPQTQTPMKRTVLIGKFAPSLLRPVIAAMNAFYQRTGISYFQPWKQRNVQIVVISIRFILIMGIPIGITINIVVYHAATNHDSLVFLHFGCRRIKQP